jgi:hypothetical protein
MYISSVKNTALIKGWQLFQDISLRVTQLTDCAAVVDDDDNNNVLTSHLHRSFAKIYVSIYFVRVPHGCGYEDYPSSGK